MHNILRDGWCMCTHAWPFLFEPLSWNESALNWGLSFLSLGWSCLGSLQIQYVLTLTQVVCVLYDDPTKGYPPQYLRNEIPEIKVYPDGQTTPTPSAIDFAPGELLGCVSGELGLRKFLEDRGHTLVVTNSKDGKDSVLRKEIVDADVVISQPFFPAYITKEIMDSAPNLKLCLTAGIGSDHVDLQEAITRKMTVGEITFCNSISVGK